MISEKSAISTPIPAFKRAASFVGLLCAGLLAFPSSAPAAIPQGVFSLGNSGNPAPNAVLANPDVTGISIRYGWKELEPTEGDFYWDWLDEEVARATAAGKQVMLRIMTQSGKPGWVSKAVLRHGGKFFAWDDNGETTTIPVFWDPTFLAKKKGYDRSFGSAFY